MPKVVTRKNGARTIIQPGKGIVGNVGGKGEEPPKTVRQPSLAGKQTPATVAKHTQHDDSQRVWETYLQHHKTVSGELPDWRTAPREHAEQFAAKMRRDHPALSNVTLTLNPNRDMNENPTLTVATIVVDENTRNAGVGTAVMKDIVEHARNNGWDVVLTPSDAYGGSVKKLNKFYRNFGFVPNKGKNRNWSSKETLILPF